MRLLSVCLLIFIADMVAAETVRVRSGEHDGYTRIVFDIPARTQWDVDDGLTGLRIRFRDPVTRIDASRVFDRISRDRVARVSTSGDLTSIDVDFACRCRHELFLATPTMLVLDVSDAPQLAISGSIDSFSSLRLANAPGLGFETSGIRSSTRDFLPYKFGQSQVLTGIDPDILTTEQALGSSTFRAEPSRPAVSGRDQAMPSLDPDDPTDVSRLPNVEVYEGSDRPAALALGEPDSIVCTGDERYMVRDWLFQQPTRFSATASVFDELDQLETAELTSIIKATIAAGFGTEARQIASLIEDDIDPRIISLSYIIDGDPDPLGSFAGRLACPNSDALWSFLGSGADGNPGAAIPIGGSVHIIAAFDSLPPHLKPHLGARLLQRFSDAADIESAEIVRNLLRNATVSIAAALDGAGAEESEDSGSQSRPEQTTPPQTPGTRSAQGPLDLVLGIETQKPLTHAQVEEILALHAEYRDSPDATEILRTLVPALAMAGRFDEAFEYLGEIDATETEIVSGVTNDLFVRLAGAATDIEFLSHTQSLSDVDGPSLNSEARLDVARRYLDMGFPQPALDLTADPEGRQLVTVRQLRSKAYLLLGDALSSREELAGLNDRDSQILRARAFVEAGDLQAALDSFRQSQADENTDYLNFELENWGDLSQSEDPAIRQVAFQKRELQPEEPAQPNTGAGIEASRQQALSTIESYLTLLDAFDDTLTE